MARIARTEADRATDAAKDATDNVAELGGRTADATAELTRETAGRSGNTARSGLQSMREAVDAAAEVERQTAPGAGQGVAEIAESLVDFITEQTRHNVEHFQALSQPTNWSHAARLQSQFWQASWMRTARFTRRYCEVSQVAMTSALSTARGQARKSA